MAITFQSFALDRWVEPSGGLGDLPLPSAVDGQSSSARLELRAGFSRPWSARARVRRTGLRSLRFTSVPTGACARSLCLG